MDIGGLYTETVVVESAEYVRKFRCKCGDCRSVCCSGWRISLSKGEYFSLMGLSCEPPLRVALNEAFTVAKEPSEEKYAYITPDKRGNCRLLDGDGLCRLHRECGENVQPSVCRLYPRSIKPGDITEFCCSGSCEAVIETLMQLPYPLSFVREELQVSASRPEEDSMDDAKRSRRAECMGRMQDRRISLPQRIADIGVYLGVREEPNEQQLLQRGLLLLTELGTPSLSLRTYAKEIPAALGMTDAVTEEVCRRFADTEAHAAVFSQREIWLEQCLVNHLYYMQFPYAGEGVSPQAAWDELYGTYALLRLLAAFTRDPVDFADRIAAAFRYIEHTDFVRNAHIVLRGHR